MQIDETNLNHSIKSDTEMYIHIINPRLTKLFFFKHVGGGGLLTSPNVRLLKSIILLYITID